MTLQEQVGQLFILGFDGTGVIQPLRRFLREFRPGGMILFARNLDSPVQVAHLTNDLQAAVPDGPLLMAIDQEGGRVSRLPAGFTVFPASGVLGQGDASELAYAAAAATAAELRAVGINLNTAPVLD
ncbi:MAG: glycoside hydrolase family 3 N-terminal domain-containing protein, partial [Nitrospirales bacterium]